MYQVSVKALCSFTAKQGDLDMRFTPAPSALDGMQGHRIVAARRGAGYKAEVSLQAGHELLTVRGRADGYDADARRIDECKTFRGVFARIPDNRHSLHWAQVQTYGAQLCRRDALDEIELALVYFDIDTQEETVLKERFTARQLEALFAERCGQFSAWARFEIERAKGRNASLCAWPYYLSQEMVRWADVVIADYNHYFDHGGLLHTMMLEDDWRVGVLVDEAHNLIDRGRDMYSITISEAQCYAARMVAPAQVKTEIGNLKRAIDDLADAQEDVYVAYDELPRMLLRTLKTVAVRLGEFTTQEPNAVPPQLLEFYFATLQFCRLADNFAEHSLFDLQRDERAGRSSISIRSVIPSAYLKQKFGDAECAVLFSATLSPAPFYRDVLGLPKDTAFLDAPSPFSSEQLQVHVTAHISTRYRNRITTLAAIDATSALAASGPMPGIFSSFRLSSLLRCHAMICRSNCLTCRSSSFR